MPFIEIKNATYSYPVEEGKLAVPVVLDFSLSVEKGEFVALLGHNGSGKSTVSRLCNAMLVPQNGEVIVDGLSTADEKNTFEIRKRVGLVLQNPDNQLVAGVVEEDVAFGPENLGIAPTEIRQRVKKALTAVDMFEYRSYAPHKLSGGQKQRVAIAGVLAMEPDCIVLDEPTAMLDPKGREEVMNTLRALQKKQGIAVILITHFMDEAAQADRVVVMSDGRKLTEGSPRQVFSQTDLLRENHLDIPQSVELCEALRQRGVKFPENILTSEEAIEAIANIFR